MKYDIIRYEKTELEDSKSYYCHYSKLDNINIVIDIVKNLSDGIVNISVLVTSKCEPDDPSFEEHPIVEIKRLCSLTWAKNYVRDLIKKKFSVSLIEK